MTSDMENGNGNGNGQENLEQYFHPVDDFIGSSHPVERKKYRSPLKAGGSDIHMAGIMLKTSVGIPEFCIGISCEGTASCCRMASQIKTEVKWRNPSWTGNHAVSAVTQFVPWFHRNGFDIVEVCVYFSNQNGSGGITPGRVQHSIITARNEKRDTLVCVAAVAGEKGCAIRTEQLSAVRSVSPHGRTDRLAKTMIGAKNMIRSTDYSPIAEDDIGGFAENL